MNNIDRKIVKRNIWRIVIDGCLAGYIIKNCDKKPCTFSVKINEQEEYNGNYKNFGLAESYICRMVREYRLKQLGFQEPTLDEKRWNTLVNTFYIYKGKKI